MVFADAARFASITLKNVRLENFRNKVILTDGNGTLEAGDTGLVLRKKEG